MHASYDMQGKIHRGAAATAGDTLAVIDKEIFAGFRVGIKFSQRVDMLVMRGGTFASKQARLGQNEGAGIESTQCRPGASPSVEGAMQWSAVVGLGRPARRDNDDVLTLILDVTEGLGANAHAVAGRHLASDGRGDLPSKERGALQVVRGSERVKKSNGCCDVEIRRDDEQQLGSRLRLFRHR